ncbi:MAG: helicase HerA domain-containing protein [Promethearchaeota archaeon]
MGSTKSYIKESEISIQTEDVGTIYSSPIDSSPNTNHFLFIINTNVDSSMVRQGMFCSTKSEEGLVIGRIEEIYVNNEYYANPQTVKNFDQGYLSNISTYFPSDKWEDFLAYVKVLGVFPKITPSNHSKSTPTQYNTMLRRSYFPVKPGGKVQIVQGDLLNNFLGMDEIGLEIGSLEHYNTPVKINLTRLINKHTAILAMSGAGKSYLVSVLLEELLHRTKTKQGTPGVLLFDVHGEYGFFTDHNVPNNKFYAKFSTRYDAKYFQIGVPSLSAYDFAKYQPHMSNAQIRELKKIINTLKYEQKRVKYGISDIIEQLEQEEGINQKVKGALIGWLLDLDRLRIFSDKNHPKLRNYLECAAILKCHLFI